MRKMSEIHIFLTFSFLKNCPASSTAPEKSDMYLDISFLDMKSKINFDSCNERNKSIVLY